MRISVASRLGSSLMRVMSAAPRGLAANSRSSATTGGRSAVMASMARTGSESANVSTGPLLPTRSRSAGISSGAAIRMTFAFAIGLQSSRTAHALRGVSQSRL